MTPASFRKIVWAHYKKQGRHDLPWRKTHDLYRILVSEVMLQQTQVDRAIPFYKAFIKKFPTAQKLAEVSLAELLKCWQGLGYNRRAKMLHQTAKELATSPPSRFDLGNLDLRSNLDGGRELVAELEKLPGVGPYTARAVAAFAYNQDTIVIETNIRTAIIHHFFSHERKVSDSEIEKVLTQVLPKGKSREWYSALMDYGAHLKRLGVSHTAQSAHHTKQSKFVGSLREIRGAIIRELSRTSAIKSNLIATLEHTFGEERHAQFLQALDALCYEGLVEKKGYRYRLTE